MRRAPTRRSEDQTPQREAVQRPAQQPERKQPTRPIATAKKIPGAAASSTAPVGKSNARRAASATNGAMTRKPSTAQPPRMMGSSGWRTEYQTFAPISPDTNARTEATSGQP